MAHGVVQHALLEPALADGAEHSVIKRGGRHDHVVACVRSQHGRLVKICGNMLALRQGADIVPVGDDEAVKAQLPAQDVLERDGIGCERRAVDGAIRRHHRGAARLHRPRERRQERLAQLAIGHLRVAGIPRADRLAIADIVLGAGEDVLVVVRRVALIAAHDRRAQRTRQERILAERLPDAPPARVARQAQHRRKRPVQAVGGDLARRHASHLLHQRGIPRAGDGQLRREDRGALVEAVAVDRIDAEEHRDAQPRAHRLALHLARVVAQHMQKRACAQPCPAQRLPPADDCIRHLHHLRRLFLERHARKQLLHALVHL